MKTGLIILSISLSHFVLGQCASQFTGIYGGRHCHDSIYRFNSEIIEIDSTTLLIRNFAGIENFVFNTPNTEDTNYAYIDCNTNEFTLDSIPYWFPSGMVTLFGSGQIYADSIVLQITSDLDSLGPDWCIKLKKGVQVVSVNEQQILNEIEIFPNPVADHFWLDKNLIGQDFQITDLNGRVCLKGKVTERILITDLPSAIYILEIKDEDMVKRQTFIKN